MKIKYKSEYFFKKYGFPDMDNTYWEKKEDRDDYNIEEEFELPISMLSECASNPIAPKYFGKVTNIADSDYSKLKWGIELVLTEEHYPEYFV